MIRLPELSKQEGICYAVTEDGVELPVVDITHPAFRLQLSEEEQRSITERFLGEQRRFAKLPGFVRSGLLRFVLRGSLMARGLRRAEGTFLDGMTTYLFKIGAKSLGAYALPIDRRIAASLPGLSVRLRLADMAELLAECLAPRLAQQPNRPLYFLNIAGGPSLDSLNALILLARRQGELLRDRHTTVCVLDRDGRGPAFGARALQALQQTGAPLADLRIEFRYLEYDWRHPAGLAPALDAIHNDGALAIASSEGGLFEYGSDDEILANLSALAARLGSDGELRIVGSVTRDDETIRALKLTSTAATRPRGLEVFSALVQRAGFQVSRSIARPLSDQVVLEPLGN